jgi:hypothetical protein
MNEGSCSIAPPCLRNPSSGLVSKSNEYAGSEGCPRTHLLHKPVANVLNSIIRQFELFAYSLNRLRETTSLLWYDFALWMGDHRSLALVIIERLPQDGSG